ncbi:unnamed protein product [Blepharisma stoltei]|uniref:Uncharacterized protein n=1 Tax=Blepharisma stoltei TaxID=1481888 RepID=A0AAU9IW87_9CILI|nr:unnamed protein product [Blepharisma stoltei]
MNEKISLNQSAKFLPLKSENDPPKASFKDLIMMKSKTESPFSRQKKEDFSIALAKGVLIDSDIKDELEILAPVQLNGFTFKSKTNNPRELLRENLKKRINDRKTAHMEAEAAFTKTSTELEGKNKPANESESDSEFHPEEEEALELQKIIQLEEGESSESAESIEDKDPENVKDKCEESSDTESETETDIEENKNESNKETENTIPNLNIQESAITDSITVATSPFIPVEKRKAPRFVSKFLEDEAELGSDHEEHDDLVKVHKDNDESSGDDKDLEELIDAGEVDEAKEMLEAKFLGDMAVQDHQQLQKVVNADFKRKRNQIDYLNDTPTIGTKKMKLMEQKKQILENREKGVVVENQFGMACDNTEELDEEEMSKLQLLRETHSLKLIRNQFSCPIEIDEKSLSYLMMLEKPENKIPCKSLLGENDKSNSIRVFRENSNLTSNKSFVFSKGENKEQKGKGIFEKKRKTKLYKMLSN